MNKIINNIKELNDILIEYINNNTDKIINNTVNVEKLVFSYEVKKDGKKIIRDSIIFKQDNIWYYEVTYSPSGRILFLGYSKELKSLLREFIEILIKDGLEEE